MQHFTVVKPRIYLADAETALKKIIHIINILHEESGEFFLEREWFHHEKQGVTQAINSYPRGFYFRKLDVPENIKYILGFIEKSPYYNIPQYVDSKTILYISIILDPSDAH